MVVYLDESGDLGWSFSHPYRQGGSSRFLTIAFLLCPKEKVQVPKRIVKKLYKQRGQSTSHELKASALTGSERKYFATQARTMFDNHGCFKYIAITVKKENVFDYIRRDSNKLYNYMIRLALVDYISAYPNIDFVPDPRTIKVKSQNSLLDYLQTHLWFEMNVPTRIFHLPQESQNNLNLQFVDFLANIIWRRYEDSDRTSFNIIRDILDHRPLFF